MVKKKISGQTIAIIILTVLLLLTIVFGGVYAYYSARSNKVSGKIEMANLKIMLASGDSDKSEIVISNGTNIVPGQPLKNSALTVENLSSTEIYLIVVYEIKAEKDDGTVVKDNHKGAVIDIDVEYINSVYNDFSSSKGVVNNSWIDYVFEADSNDTNADEIVIDSQTGATKRVYRCLVSKVDFEPTAENDDPIIVIGENKMSLSGDMGNDYQNTDIVFTFQAYAIGANTFSGVFNSSTSNETKCEYIVNAIYTSQGKTFFNLD